MDTYPPQAKQLDWELLVQQISAYVEVLGGAPSASGAGDVVELCEPLGMGVFPSIYTTQNGAERSIDASSGHAPTIWPEGSYASVVIFSSRGAYGMDYAAWRFPAGCTDTGGYGTALYACEAVRRMAGIDDDSLEWEDGSSAPVPFRAWPTRSNEAPTREEAPRG